MTRRLDIAAVAAFSEEVRVSIPAILTALDAVERDASDAASVQEAFRLVHALKGAASMVGLSALGHLLNYAEELVEAAMTTGDPFPGDLLKTLRETVPRFGEYLNAALGGRPFDELAFGLLHTYREFANQSSETGDAEAALRELLDIEQKELTLQSEPAAPPAPPPDYDIEIVPTEPIPAELAEVFAQEAQEHLQTIARLTVDLGGSPDDRDSLLELRRAVHTIKGAAGVVGYKGASRLAHRMEDLLDAVAEGTAVLTPDSARLLTASSDALDDLISATSDPAVLRDTFRRLLAEYDRFVTGVPAVAPIDAAPAQTSEPSASFEPVADAPLETPAAAVAEAPVPDRRRATRDRRQGTADRRAGSQVVRVPFQRLNELVRVVSELVLNRATFDQHYACLIDQVDELRLSTARLRRVAQKLETDYEVRALSGSLASGVPAPFSGGHGFDDLEFDRYTDFHLLTRELTETASDIGTVTSRLGETIGDFDGDITRLGRLTREVQDKAMEFRMVPLVTLAARLERAVRVTAQDCGKAVDLVLEGENVALDKTLLEEMADALVHLLRNSVDHGIEPPAVRSACGKRDRGRIIVRAYHEGTDVVIEVEDDGGGLDVERIRRAAVEKGYVGEGESAQLSVEELSSFVFEPGFSTALRVSEVSGRGVGLDIVKSKVGRLGGRIRMTSRPGAGATVTVRVPMTLAITRVLLVRAGGQTLGLPLGAILQIVRADSASIAHVGVERVVNVDGRTYPLKDLAETLGLPRGAEHGRQPVLIANLGGRQIAMAVDQIVQTRDAVVKTLGTHLRRVSGVWGATLLGDGTVVLILNPTDLAGSAEEPRVRRTKGHAAPSRERDVHNILIVDDSLSMRHVLSNMVKKAGWNALQARDGVEALEILEAAAPPPDLVLLDIEMPRMDGYEFLATVRGQKGLASLPIVMLTSRGGEKHRDKALGLGASGYVVKPFQEEALLQTMTALMHAGWSGRKAAS